MLIKEMGKMQDILVGWSEKEIHLVNQMIKFLRKFNLTLGDFEKYADYLQEKRFITEKAGQNALVLYHEYVLSHPHKCPECGKDMNLDPVNQSPCGQINDKKIKSVFTCIDEDGCGYQRWNQKPVWFYIEKIRREFYRTIKDKTVEEMSEVEIDRNRYKFPRSGPVSLGKNKLNIGGCKEKRNGS